MVHESLMIGKLNVARDDLNRAKRELKKALDWIEEHPGDAENSLRFLKQQAEFAVDEIDEAGGLVWEYQSWLSCEKCRDIWEKKGGDDGHKDVEARRCISSYRS